MACIVVAHAKTMNCFASAINTSVCLVYKCKSAHKAGRQRARPSSDLEVIFVEVKSGSARLNHNERSLKDAIENKRVRWHEYHVPAPLTNSHDPAIEPVM